LNREYGFLDFMSVLPWFSAITLQQITPILVEDGPEDNDTTKRRTTKHEIPFAFPCDGNGLLTGVYVHENKDSIITSIQVHCGDCDDDEDSGAVIAQPIITTTTAAAPDNNSTNPPPVEGAVQQQQQQIQQQQPQPTVITTHKENLYDRIQGTIQGQIQSSLENVTEYGLSVWMYNLFFLICLILAIAAFVYIMVRSCNPV
jgi:hypothetical protein